MSLPLQPEEVLPVGEPILHPIQLEFVAVKELTVRTLAPATKEYRLPEGRFELGGSISPVDKGTRRFQASVTATIGDEKFSTKDLPLYLRIELVGGFIITREDISDEQATSWAFHASKFTLMPYLREQVAGLTGRVGFTPVLLPLVQLPNSSGNASTGPRQEFAPTAVV